MAIQVKSNWPTQKLGGISIPYRSKKRQGSQCNHIKVNKRLIELMKDRLCAVSGPL